MSVIGNNDKTDENHDTNSVLDDVESDEYNLYIPDHIDEFEF